MQVCNSPYTAAVRHALIVHNSVLFCIELMLHKWHYIYILCCCNSLHRQVVPVASEHADVRVFSPSAPTNRSHQLKATYRRHERRVYEQSVQEVERASFTSLVFAASGGMGKATPLFSTNGRQHSLRRSDTSPTAQQWGGFTQH